MKDITSVFNEAVKQEYKENKEYYDGRYGKYIPDGYWSKEFTHLDKPFFVPSARQDINQTAMPPSLWHGLWHQGEMCCLFGEPNVGKSVLANMIAYEVATAGTYVLYIDFENSPHQAAARYHDPNERNQLFIPDHLNFVTVNPQLTYKNSHNYNLVLDAIEHEFVTKETPVVIIDDISHICPLRDCKAAQEVMRRMRQWIIKYSVSILVIAHAVRQRSACPLAINSLFGASHTAYCFDSIFAIGRDMRNADNRYVKQLKSRITAINYGDSNVISLKLKQIGYFLCFVILGAGNIERDLLAIPEITDRQTLMGEVSRLKAINWSARQIANRLSLSHTTINSIISEIELSSISNVERVECVEKVETTTEKVENPTEKVEPSACELDGESSGQWAKPVPRPANLHQTVETSASEFDAESDRQLPQPATQPGTEMKSLFTPEIKQLAQSISMPMVQEILESDNLPFADWKPGDDPNISQLCLYHKENQLYRLLLHYHSPYLYNSFDSFSLHVHDYHTSTTYRLGSLVYFPSSRIIGRANVGMPDWFDGQLPEGTTIEAIEEKLHQAARILRDKVLSHNPEELDPRCLTRKDIDAAASTVALPPTIVASALYLPYDNPQGSSCQLQ